MQGVPDRAINKAAGEYASVTNVYEYFDYGKLMRAGICHSVEIDIAIKNGCIKNDKKNIFLIGDSFAAALYNGLDNFIKNNNNGYVISQMTDGNGPPLFIHGLDDLHRDVFDINNNRLSQIKSSKPEIILMSWFVYGANKIDDKHRVLNLIGETINKIKNISPTSKIVVVGPVPNWNSNLVKVLANYYIENKKAPPVYMTYGLDASIKAWDDYFSNNIPSYNVTYISALQALCNQSGCLTRDGDGPQNVTAVDWGHLTRTGSAFLLNKIGNRIF